MRTLFSFISAASLVAAGLAFADTTTKSDQKGDSKRGEYDLKSASVAHAGPDTFKHTTTTYNTSSHGRSLRLDISTDGRNERPGYFIARFEGKPSIYKHGRRKPTRVGPAKFKRHSAKKFSYTFNLKHMGLPGRYHWQWAVNVYGSFEPADRLPDRGLATHNVDTGH